MIVEQVYTTERGRRRRHQVRIDPDEVRRRLGMPTTADLRDWQQIRELLEAAAGESTFAIWLEPAELIAVDDEHRLVVAVPAAMASWITTRFGRLLTGCAERVGRQLRFASEPEVHAVVDAEVRVQQTRREVAG